LSHPRGLVLALLPGLVALASAVVLAAALSLAAGADPVVAVTALVQGSVGSITSVTQTLVRTTPLILTGIAVMVGFQSGVFNIGAEGQFLAGALVATAIGVGFEPFFGQAVVALLSGALAGALWASMAAALRIGRGVHEVITTILLNFIALYLVSWAVEGPLQEASGNYPQSDRLASTALLWRLPATRVHAGVVLAFATAAIAGLVMSRTRLGLRLRASGLNPVASRFAGFPVTRDLAVAFAFSGALAGLAGAVEVAGVTGRLFERIASGYGYTAIAIALLGGLRAPGVVAAALFFAALSTGAGAMERSAGVSSVMVLAVQGATLLAIALLNDKVRRRFLPGTTAGGADAA
jgi:general nucleoside transport system permease protein